MTVDPVSLEVFKNLFISVAEEMGVALQRTAYSANIKERRDFSCGVFDPQGQMVAQAAPPAGASRCDARFGAGRPREIPPVGCVPETSSFSMIHTWGELTFPTSVRWRRCTLARKRNS